MRFPVSFAQQRLWFLDQLTPGEPTFHMPYAIWLEGPVDADALQRALDAVVARHTALRTSIVAIDGVPEQVVADTARVVIDRIVLDGPERTRQAESIAAGLAVRPFDLARGPLMRATLVAAASDRWLFLLVIHHIISDARSLAIMLDELSAAYRAELTGAAVSADPLWMDYGDYAVWQRDRLRGEELERQLGYWREQLRDAPQLLAVPTDRPRSSTPTSRGALVGATVGATTTRLLRDVAHRANATMFMALLAGLAVVLSRYARQTDLVIGAPVSGRLRVELEPVVGMFTNMVPLRISLAGDPTLIELLGRVRDVTVEALTHEELPFEKLIEDLRPDRTLSHAPLIQCQFAHQSLAVPPLDLPGVTAYGRALFTGTAKADLTMYADTAADDESTLVLEYSSDLFDAPFADRLVHSMATMLDHAARAPHTAVADLPLLPPAELSALTTGRPARPVGSADIRPLLRESASTVTDGSRTVSMVQVCDRAARIARVLADHGAGPETTVGLCLARGVDTLSALLGVWWAGAAYVPLDPDFPRARLAAMARDADLRIVLSDRTHRELAAGSATSSAAELLGPR